jgi:kynurenine formamidase
VLDVARWRAAQGRPIDCNASDVITVADLEGTARAQNVEFRPGDVWIIHLGWVEWYERQTPQKLQQMANMAGLRTPGLECSEAMAEWIFDHHPASLCSDNPALECWPPPNFMEPDGFLHHWIIGRFGMAIGEMFQTTHLAADCASDGVYEGLFVSAPLNIAGGTGSPPNALVIK